MSELNEDFFIGDSSNASKKNGEKSSCFPSKFKCVVCDLQTTSLMNLHQHQKTQHSLEELSLSIIAMQSYIYHKEYLEPNRPANGLKNQCRFYPFCTELLSIGGENIEGNWKALVSSKNEPLIDSDDIQFIVSLENPSIPAFKAGPSPPALRKPGTAPGGGDIGRSPLILPSRTNTSVPSNSPVNEILNSINGKQLEKIKAPSKPSVKRLGTNALKPLRRPNIDTAEKIKLSISNTSKAVVAPEKSTSTTPLAVPNAKTPKYSREVRRPMWKPLKPLQLEDGEIVDMNLSD